MLDWLHNRTLALRIYLLAGVAVFGLLTVLVAYLVSSQSITDSQDLSQTYAKALLHQKTLEAQSLQIRRHEKDFLLRRDEKYIARYTVAMTDALNILAELEQLDAGPEMRQALGELKNILPAHQRQFSDVADAMIKLGLDETLGLQGALRAAVHEIETLLKDNKNDKLEIIMLMMRRHEKDFILRIDPKYIDRIALREAEFRQALTAARLPAGVGQKMAEKLTAYVAAFNAYARERLALVEMVANLSKIYAETVEPFAMVSRVAEDLSVRAQRSAAETGGFAFTLILSVSIIIVLLASVIAWAVVKTTVRPVKGLADTLAAISGGDYTVPIPGTRFKDELGDMARVIEQLRDSAGERVRMEAEEYARVEALAAKEREAADAKAAEQRAKIEAERERRRNEEARGRETEALVLSFDKVIGGAINDLEQASNTMRSTSGEMVDVAELTGKQVSAVAAASGSMQDNVATMAAAIEEFTASISEMNGQIRRASTISAEAVQTSERGNQAISTLSDNSKQIEAIVKLINDIAEQTNLLALNATIEAARAGDAGKGFAVVASEVKSLASQTAQATEQITAQINEMQSITDDAVDAVTSIGKSNQSLNEVMVAIASAITEQQATTNEISRSVQHTANGTTQVAKEIAEVSKGAEKTGAESSSVMSAADKLGLLAATIKDEVNGFLGKVRELQAG